MTRFTPDEDAAILRGGWDDRTLADMLFVSITVLRTRRRELNRAPRLPYTPRPPSLRNGYTFWSPAQDQRLWRLHGSGMTYPQIAENIGRSRESVASRLKRLRGAQA